MLKKTLPTPFNGDRRKQRLFWSKAHAQALKELGGRASSPTSLNGGEHHCFSTWQRLQRRKCSSRPRSQHKYDFSWREWGSLHKCCLPSEPLIQVTAKFSHQKVLLKSAWSPRSYSFSNGRGMLYKSEGRLLASGYKLGIPKDQYITDWLTLRKSQKKKSKYHCLSLSYLCLPLAKCVVLYKII